MSRTPRIMFGVVSRILGVVHTKFRLKLNISKIAELLPLPGFLLHSNLQGLLKLSTQALLKVSPSSLQALSTASYSSRPTRKTQEMAQSIPPGDIQTQPNAKIVFNAPYDDKRTYHIKVSSL